MSVTLILGGARSGKSTRAQAFAEHISAERCYIATAQAFDDEMTERISRHQLDRDSSWTTFEEPLELSQALSKCVEGGHSVILVDCLTLWLSNIMLDKRDIEAETEKLIATLAQTNASIIFVSNEVGMGLVPDNALGREFRDAQGRLNQKIAALADKVEFIAAGLPLILKG